MTDMEKRIEAMVAEMVRRPEAGDDIGEALWNGAQSVARQYLAAAFPELFASPPSMWLAPVEPTKEIILAGEEQLEEETVSDWDSGGDGNSHNSYTYFRSGHIRSVFLAMMRAHLSSAPEEERDNEHT